MCTSEAAHLGASDAFSLPAAAATEEQRKCIQTHRRTSLIVIPRNLFWLSRCLINISEMNLGHREDDGKTRATISFRRQFIPTEYLD